MIKAVVVDTTGGKTVGPAIPVEVMVSTGGLPVEGKLLRVVEVTAADVAAGRGKVVGGRPIPVVLGTVGLDMIDGPIQQVYVTSGSLSPVTVDPTLVYTNKVKALNPIAYWPQAEASGNVALDESGNGRNGTYTAVTLGVAGIGDGRTAPSFDGATSYNNVFSASLAAAFSGVVGTAHVWFRLPEIVDGTNRFMLNLFADVNNRVVIDRSAPTTMRWRYIAGGTTKTLNITVAVTTWQSITITWNKVGDQAIGYSNGVQNGVTQTGLGVFAGSIGTALIGASTAAPTFAWNGLEAHVALWNRVLSAAEVLSLATVP